jgi:hypothetical protein
MESRREIDGKRGFRFVDAIYDWGKEDSSPFFGKLREMQIRKRSNLLLSI